MPDDMNAQVAAVRALHTRIVGTRRIENNVELDPPKAVAFCSECEFVEWPCPTIRALDAASVSVVSTVTHETADLKAITDEAIRDVCEMEPADAADAENVVCVRVDALRAVIEDAVGAAVLAANRRTGAGALDAIRTAWPGLEGAANHGTPIALQDGVLVVRAPSVGDAGHLTFMEPEIVQSLSAYGVKQLRLRVTREGEHRG